ncbi:MAG TPA: hypothetical protein V6C71_17045 [Coleofasciculaceae cyanobacterium]|jgi:hypothetical protein
MNKIKINSHLPKPAIETLTKYLKSHPELKLDDPKPTVRVMVGTLNYFTMLQEMPHGKDILPLESDRPVNTLTRMITTNKKISNFTYFCFD